MAAATFATYQNKYAESVEARTAYVLVAFALLTSLTMAGHIQKQASEYVKLEAGGKATAGWAIFLAIAVYGIGGPLRKSPKMLSSS